MRASKDNVGEDVSSFGTKSLCVLPSEHVCALHLPSRLILIRLMALSALRFWS